MRLSTRVIWLALTALVLSACGTITGGAKIDELETKNAQLQATIDMVGTPVLTIIALEQYATQNVVLQARLSQAENESLAARATLTVLELGSGMAAAQPTPPPPDVSVSPNNQVPVDQVTPGEPVPASTPETDNSLTQFSQTVTATDLNPQDCPLNITAVFEPTEDTIYVDTQINYLPAGSRIGAQWTANGQLYFDDVECWVPNQDYFDICAYCMLTPEGGTFAVGTWTVALMLNGQLMSQASFQVMDSSQPAEATPEGTSTSWKGN